MQNDWAKYTVSSFGEDLLRLMAKAAAFGAVYPLAIRVLPLGSAQEKSSFFTVANFLTMLFFLILHAAFTSGADSMRRKRRDGYARAVNSALREGSAEFQFALYIRAFSTEGKLLSANPDYQSTPVFPSSVSQQPKLDLEVLLASALESRCPLIALGSHGQRIVGSGRIETGDEEWQENFKLLANRATLILVVPSDSKSVVWELQWLSAHHLAKTIFVQPAEYKEMWERVRVIAPEFYIELPPATDTLSLITFSGVWAPPRIDTINEYKSSAVQKALLGIAAVRPVSPPVNIVEEPLPPPLSPPTAPAPRSNHEASGIGTVLKAGLLGALIAIVLAFIGGIATFFLTGPLSGPDLAPILSAQQVLCAFVGGWFAARRCPSRWLSTSILTALISTGVNQIGVLLSGSFEWWLLCADLVASAFGGYMLKRRANRLLRIGPAAPAAIQQFSASAGQHNPD